ncbi:MULTISPECIES: UTP--glucose-1-phosphate uridylyltransferase [Paracoccus]|jgi:UTP--glucose-1-phosphate uridylyltransferase|uniref:UTP--glucose-1-phosphate uridylyltransferase n=2 Tax=Paracoccus TaxID=265 RepID=A0A5C4R633_9RHOB|nr:MULTISPECIES: UTP--glucose-1-phosphate uridylyltransferase [Paracoccus]TYP69092.1 UDP-glucose pyrophosphorylase [Stutzerimonas stutzeri]AZY92486.1 UTP--glucose-1-phosphate uridylyltransferase [Paracoccus sp. Arc7-R13]KIX17358.1 UTP--glucose-1-phosphate uridylyltransferase [Paracoccus sp. 228]KJZ31205.1 UTP--glucose-1-phosphate uridylyltransferase [Paracoccus sp. S4493]MBF5078949.1 UTP--glucose-1-phosphate uridylyltransferase [Paracoccus sp. NBH48]|tara:strand:- start:1198 stop:2094 length:897 start_codon:yes stop_codon:yes gene_type:complete
MGRKVTKAIFPVAGLGTRFLPTTKSIPKEMLSLVDKPLIQYAIDEARAAGIKEFIFVTSRGKGSLEDYFDHAHELESSLKKAGKTELLEILRATNMDSGAIAYIRQHKALGLGHAVWCARRLLSDDEPFAVVLTDDVIQGEPPCLQQMIEAYGETGGSMVATMEVAPEKAKAYGVLDVAEDMGAIVRAKGMVEKPATGTQPSNLAVIGRYILAPTVMKNLNKLKQGAGGEIQLTDAIAEEIQAGRDVFGLRFRGQRFDCGSKAGFLQATVAFGLERDELKDEFAEYLHEVMSMRRAAE